MITLHIAIGKEDTIPTIKFNLVSDLMEYMKGLRQFNCVWLCSGKSPNSEIVITEDVGAMLAAVATDIWNKEFVTDWELHIHEYPSYEDAYKVALGMREGNEKCYNKNHE